jgi:transcriptional regulator with XRE-family HTH domain
MIRLKAERLKRGWSQGKLAYRAKMAGSDVCRLERGYGFPYPAQARRLAAVLGLNVAELMAPVTDNRVTPDNERSRQGSQRR